MTIDPDFFPEDTLELLRFFQKFNVKYLVVGGRAVILHAYTRATGDSDLFFSPDPSNVEKLYSALEEFWGGEPPGIENIDDLTQPGTWIQFGHPPGRIDLLNNISGVEFDGAWERRVEETLDTDPPVTVYFISLEDLISTKEAAGRLIDQADLEYLRESRDRDRNDS